MKLFATENWLQLTMTACCQQLGNGKIENATSEFVADTIALQFELKVQHHFVPIECATQNVKWAVHHFPFVKNCVAVANASLCRQNLGSACGCSRKIVVLPPTQEARKQWPAFLQSANGHCWNTDSGKSLHSQNFALHSQNFRSNKWFSNWPKAANSIFEKWNNQHSQFGSLCTCFTVWVHHFLMQRLLPNGQFCSQAFSYCCQFSQCKLQASVCNF